jgi:hypothetical protein
MTTGLSGLMTTGLFGLIKTGLSGLSVPRIIRL